MRIYWDPEKNRKLILERGIDLERIADMILDEEYVEILEHPTRKNQQMILLILDGYLHVVPFVFDDENDICLKTAYPSRKYHRKYGSEQDET